MIGAINVPRNFKTEHERHKEIFMVIKKLNYMEKALKEKIQADVYEDQRNNLINKYKAASSGIYNFDLDNFVKDFGLASEFYAIQLIKNPEQTGGNQSSIKILDILHELDNRIAIDKPNQSAYVSQYKLMLSEIVDNFGRLSHDQKLKINEIYMETVYSYYQELLGKQGNDLLEEIQLTILQNHLYRFSQAFRRVIMS